MVERLVAQVEHEPDSCPPWEAGSEVVVGTSAYVLDRVGLSEVVAPDASHVRRQALALQVSPVSRRGARYVWLRQVLRRRPSEAAKAARAALLREHQLLARLGRMPGVPQLPQLDDPVSAASTTTLAVAWPASTLRRGPSETLADQLAPAASVAFDDPVRRVRLLAGLAGVCVTLGRLHARHRVAHRKLTPDGVIRQDDGRLLLRDLGLAARPPGRGEAPTAYQAPEQRSGSAGPRPGSATDVYQVAALAYHLLTGQVPVVGRRARPDPIHDLAPAVPDAAAAAIDAALALAPDQRPEITALAVALRTRSAEAEAEAVP